MNTYRAVGSLAVHISSCWRRAARGGCARLGVNPQSLANAAGGFATLVGLAALTMEDLELLEAVGPVALPSLHGPQDLGVPHRSWRQGRSLRRWRLRALSR